MHKQNTTQAGDAAIEYEVVVSKRASRITMRVLPGRGLVVSAPQGVKRQTIHAFVDSQRQWIEKSLADIEAMTLPQYRLWPPRSLSLNAINKQLILSFTDDAEGFADDADEHENKLSQWGNLYLPVQFATEQKAAVADSVAEHLKGIARVFLPPMLASRAHLHGLEYQRVSIRGQRTVWGSYSSKGTLSLNYKLLFLPGELVDYVLLHELAHTVHLDHSKAFWELLCQLNINARMLDKQLRKAGTFVPPWLA